MFEPDSSKKKFSTSDVLYTISRAKKLASQHYLFDSLKTYVMQAPAFQDQDTRIMVDNDAIYFGHNLFEIAASFPHVLEFESLSFKTEERWIIYGIYGDLEFKVTNSLAQKQKDLQQEAKQFFESFSMDKTKQIGNMPIHNPDELISLFQNAKAVTVGEVHTCISSKKILVDNMYLLKKNGVDAIFLEHVFIDTQTELFEHYFQAHSLRMPVILTNYFVNLDKKFNIPGNQFRPYSFTGLVVQAKRYGIKIIPIDTTTSYSTNSLISETNAKNRNLMMNYIAAQQFAQKAQSFRKILFFVGSSHINNTDSGIPGMAEITGCPTLVVEDIQPNESPLTPSTHPVRPDSLIYMDRELSPEAQELTKAYMYSLTSTSNSFQHVSLDEHAVSLSSESFKEELLSQSESDLSQKVLKLQQSINNLKLMESSNKEIIFRLGQNLDSLLQGLIDSKQVTEAYFAKFENEFSSLVDSHTKLLAKDIVKK